MYYLKKKTLLLLCINTGYLAWQRWVTKISLTLEKINKISPFTEERVRKIWSWQQLIGVSDVWYLMCKLLFKLLLNILLLETAWESIALSINVCNNVIMRLFVWVCDSRVWRCFLGFDWSFIFVHKPLHVILNCRLTDVKRRGISTSGHMSGIPIENAPLFLHISPHSSAPLRAFNKMRRP